MHEHTRMCTLLRYYCTQFLGREQKYASSVEGELLVLYIGSFRSDFIIGRSYENTTLIFPL